MFKLASVVVLVLLASSLAHGWRQVSEYCPTNPRRSGAPLSGENLPEFSFLLTCPTGKPAYLPERIVDLGDGLWMESYIDIDAEDFREMADDDILNFNSLFANGFADTQQQACSSWDLAFVPDNQAQVFATGSGLPIVVGQDRRYAGQYGKAPFVGHEEGFGNLLGVNHTHLSNETQVGQWLYSVCSDAECSSATVPKPFWGRRIGEPLYQDTLAELAYFPINPDWAYNSPKLGTSYPGQGPDSFGTVAPHKIASTYVWSATGEKILVLLMNGDNTGKLVEEAGIENAETGYPDLKNSTSSWFLVWCQDEDCTNWGVLDLQAAPGASGELVRNALQSNTFAPSMVTSPDGRSVQLQTLSSFFFAPPSSGYITAELKLRSLTKNAAFRNQAMQEIYTNLIGRPSVVPFGQYNLSADAGIRQGFFGPDYSNGLTDHPLNYLYGFRGLLPEQQFTFSSESTRRPSVACVDLEAAGISNDPWCSWNYYWEVDQVEYGTSTGIPFIPLLENLLPYTEFSLVQNGCSGELCFFLDFATSPSSPFQFAPLLISCETFFTFWPTIETIPSPVEQIQDVYDHYKFFPYPIPGQEPAGFTLNNLYDINHPYPADVDRSLVYTGRRYNFIQGADGRPFFTWADLDGSLLDAAMVWGTCSMRAANTFECRTIFDSIELGTMGYLEGHHGKTVLLSGPNDGLPVMIYWFDHFGGYLNQPLVNKTVSISPGQVTSKPLIVFCLDALCDSASVSAFAPAQMADVANKLEVYNGSRGFGNHYQFDYIDSVNPVINSDASFVGDELVLLLNEGGAEGENQNNPIRLWRTNRWASPTGMPCSEANAGQSVVANDVVYYCSRLQLGSQDAELYVGAIPRPWTRLYEWVKMDWGFGLRNIGGFLGWGANRGDETYYDIALDKDPWWTDNANEWLRSPPPVGPAPVISGG